MNRLSNPETIASCYDKNYYDNYSGGIPYDRNDHWMAIFHAIADHIVRSLKPRRVLDAGCAKGFLVEALWERGVEAYGIDISEYAIREVRKDMQPYCHQAPLTSPIEERFDLITCFEVLEHVAPEDAQAVIQNLTGATDTILFSSTPTGWMDPTHINVQPTIGWLRLFADSGFAPDLVFDASFVAPHAFLLRRVTERYPDDVLILFSGLIRYKLTLTDRHRQLDHLNNQVKDLQSGKQTVEAEMATLNHQAHLLRVERHQQELKLAQLTEQTRNLTTVYSEQLRNLDSAYQRAREEAAATGHLVTGLTETVSELDRKADQVIALLTGQIQRLREEVRHLENAYQRAREETAATGHLVTGLAETVGDLDTKSGRVIARLAGVESRVAFVGQEIEGILTSRIWRVLCAAAALLLAPRKLAGLLSPSRSGAAVQTPQPGAAVTDDFYGFVCDEPQPNEDEPRSGKIAVSGWALAHAGVDRTEIRLAGMTIRVQMGAARVDVARSYPDVPGSRTAGFAGEIDTATVPDGLHIVSIRVFSRSGACRELQIPIRINHKLAHASDYDRWIADFETRNAALIQLKLRQFAENPLVSILVPVYRTPLDILRHTIESVTKQSYSNWELCIADDCSQSPEIQGLLADYASRDSRIRVNVLPDNGGISHASNAALAMAHGDFVALLDHDDELAQDALYHVVEAINLQSGVDLLYSDEDKIDKSGRRYDPFFKPDWSPDLLLSENYICHLLVVRRSRLTQAGGFRSAFDGSQDYDLVLRLTGNNIRIAHIPRVLYHWRSLPESTAASPDRKSFAAPAAQRAIQEELDRRSVAAKVVPGSIAGRWRVRYLLTEEPLVSIIIPSGGKIEPLRDNLTSLFGKTEYLNYEVVVTDNSKEADIQNLVERWPDPPRPLRYIDWRNRPFNYSVINNEAARHCQSPILLFLNDDTSVIHPGWLQAMVELAARPEVGAVGAKLLYPSGNIQHAGVIMGLFDNCGHAFKGLAGDQQHYFDLPDVIRNVSAVTGACLMTRSEVFHGVGGFDEQTFAVAFNDIDLCLKIGRKGYRVLYTPHAVLYHHEAFSKTVKDLIPHPDEVEAMRVKWKGVIEADPFYSPHLTRTAEDYSLQVKLAT
jgi:GT2 family glycosyltransferase/SAM-dependent methyltransferase